MKSKSLFTKVVAFMLCVIMAISCLPVSAFAAEITLDPNEGDIDVAGAGFTAENPMFLEWTWDEDQTVGTASVTVPKGMTMYFAVYGLSTANILLANGENVEFTPGMGRMMPGTFELTAGADASVEYNLVLTYFEGSFQNPKQAQLGDNKATVAEGNTDGFVFEYIADENGELAVSVSSTDGNWFYVVNNLTTCAYGDNHWSDDSPVVNPETVTVTAGDEIQIIVNTYNATGINPAGDITVNLAYEPEAPTPVKIVSSVSVDLGNTLAIKFIIDPDIENDGTLELIGEDNVAVISRLVDGEWTVVAEVSQKDWSTYTQGRYVAMYDQIAAKEMIDQFKVVVYNGAGYPVSIEYEDSVRAYAMRAITGMSKDPTAKKDYATQLPMFVDILNYGAAAQINFEYKTDDLANSLMTDAQKAYASAAASGENNKAGVGGTQCSIKARIEMSFTYTKTDVNQTMYAVVTYIKHTGDKFEEQILGADFKTYNGKWQIPVNGLSLADGNQMVTCKIYSADGVEIESLTTSDSVNGYWTRVTTNNAAPANLRALGEAALKVSASAYAYFHRNDK